MESRDFAVRMIMRAMRALPVVVFTLCLGQPIPAITAQCDNTGFDKPCAVQDGIYRILVPEGEGPFPAMVYLYGSGGQSTTIANHPLFIASVVDRGYALIVPAALNMEYRRGIYDSGWALRNEPGDGRDEALFIKRVIDDAARRFAIDRERVVLAGQSRGAFLIWEIACHEPETATAFAVHAGGYLGTLPDKCERPVRFLDSHGLTDSVVPFSGVPILSGGVSMAPLEQSLNLLAETNQCRQPEASEVAMMLGLQRTRWTDCTRGGSLDLLLHAGGHIMPPEWFRAVLDWFEEPPAEVEDIKPGIRAIGVRLPGRFKSVRSGGAGLTAAGEPGGGRRLQAPGGSRKASQ